MAKVKLELRELTAEETLNLGMAHKAAMASAEGLLLYPTPNPAPAVLDPALAALAAKLAEITATENALTAMRVARDDMVRNVGALLTVRSKDVEVKSGGNAEKILKAGFQVQATGSPTTSMPIPQGLRAEIGVKPGEIKLSCTGVPKAKMYVWECRLHEDGQVPGPWAGIKMGARSANVATGLTTGKIYAFRVKAMGPNDTESGWSDEAVEMAR